MSFHVPISLFVQGHHLMLSCYNSVLLTFSLPVCISQLDSNVVFSRSLVTWWFLQHHCIVVVFSDDCSCIV